MKHRAVLLLPLLLLIPECKKDETVVRIAVTTDVHGMIYPYDFIERKETDHSLAHIYSYVTRERRRKDTLFILMDNGDLLQGQPTVYYYNYIDTTSVHLSARVMNFMGYAAGTLGNHDIEAGPEVYKRIRNDFGFPWLAANAVYSDTNEPFFEPYTILKAGRTRIAVLGLITPGIPRWLPKSLWPEMEFMDMVETARLWVPRILESEDPDLMVGLFHSGTDAGYGGDTGSYLNENASLLVAEQVPGFDVIFAGHDHRVSKDWVESAGGDSVLVLDAGSHGRFAGEVTVIFDADGIVSMTAKNVPMNNFLPSGKFQEQFFREQEKVAYYLHDTITWLSEDMEGIEALFGPSRMMSLIHAVQFDLSGAELSFTAPLSLYTGLEKGAVLVSDMFRLYRFENMLYIMELSGKEIDGFLEYAAGIWFNTMTCAGDHLLLFSPGEPGHLANPYYNFSSAAGIDYTIDVSRSPGDRVSISRLSNGEEFSQERIYRVAVNSYRANGGGGHLTRGAGIPAEQLSDRVRWSSDTDLRYYLMQYLSKQDTLFPQAFSNWSCIPGPWVHEAAESDRMYFRIN